MRRNNYFNYPGRGMGEQLPLRPGAQEIAAIDEQVAQRRERAEFLNTWGDSFWLPLPLAIGTTPAAGTQFIRITTNVEFDLLILGAVSDLRLSAVQIIDSARNRALLNAPAPLWLVTDFVTATASYTSVCGGTWQAPYYLPPRSQLQVTITADGTESNGNLVFRCKMPPSYNS